MDISYFNMQMEIERIFSKYAEDQLVSEWLRVENYHLASHEISQMFVRFIIWKDKNVEKNKDKPGWTLYVKDHEPIYFFSIEEIFNYWTEERYKQIKERHNKQENNEIFNTEN